MFRLNSVLSHLVWEWNAASWRQRLARALQDMTQMRAGAAYIKFKTTYASKVSKMEAPASKLITSRRKSGPYNSSKSVRIHIRCRSSQITSRPLNEPDLHVPIRSRLVISRKIYRVICFSKNKPSLMEYKWEVPPRWSAGAYKQNTCADFTAQRQGNWSVQRCSLRKL